MGVQYTSRQELVRQPSLNLPNLIGMQALLATLW